MLALYVNPFLSACEDLQSRIYNILEMKGLQSLRKRYPDHGYADETLAENLGASIRGAAPESPGINGMLGAHGNPTVEAIQVVAEIMRFIVAILLGSGWPLNGEE